MTPNYCKRRRKNIHIFPKTILWLTTLYACKRKTPASIFFTKNIWIDAPLPFDYFVGIVASIHIVWEIQCLPYEGFIFLPLTLSKVWIGFGLQSLKFNTRETLNLFTCVDSSTNKKTKKKIAICQVRPVTCHLSTVTVNLTTNLCNFNCYDCARSFGHAAAGGLVIVW